MKKIIIFCLYSIIALSTIDLICAEKRKTSALSLNYILNDDKKENNAYLPTSAQLANQIQIVNQIQSQELQNGAEINSIVLSRSETKKYLENEIKRIKKDHIDNCNTPNGSEHENGNCIHYNPLSNGSTNIRKTIQKKQHMYSTCDIIFNLKMVEKREDFRKKTNNYRNGQRIGIVCSCGELIYGKFQYVYDNLVKHRKKHK